MNDGLESLPAAETFDRHLTEMTEAGVQADRARLLQDMISQFPEPRLFIRELVVNASDANATRCTVCGRDEGETLLIIVKDNGHGMGRDRLDDYCVVFRSWKQDPGRAAGTHGIGRLCIAAMPGQCGLRLTTSDGTETWQLLAEGPLLEAPIVLQRIEPVRPAGTCVEVRFRKSQGASLAQELERCRNILERWCRYLALDVLVLTPAGDGPDAPVDVHRIGRDWTDSGHELPRNYRFALGDVSYDVVLALGAWPEHAVYHKGVLVSTAYDLLSPDSDRRMIVPHLRIRVDCPAFRLPFGRHALLNPELLVPLGRHLRSSIVPEYGARVVAAHERAGATEERLDRGQLEAFLCGLLVTHPEPDRPWCDAPLFRLLNSLRGRHLCSLNALRGAVRDSGALFLQCEGDDLTGIDFASCNVPVLAASQIPGALDVVRSEFRDLQQMSLNEAVLEAASAPALSERERRLECSLRFSTEAIGKAHAAAAAGEEEQHPRNSRWGGPRHRSAEEHLEQIRRQFGLCEEITQSFHDLGRIRWRLAWLVGLGGAPCPSRLFLLKDGAVVMNLHHRTVQRLLDVADLNPALAGHWGLALCLAEGAGRLLPHLSPAAREDCIVADALAKCGAAPGDTAQPAGHTGDAYWDFLRDASDDSFAAA